MTVQSIPWNDAVEAAKDIMGNWRKFDCFAWHRGFHLDDADKWAVIYLSNRDSGLLDQSNAAVILKALTPYIEQDDPDVVVERHSHWAVGFLDGVSIRVRRPDGTITSAFTEYCELQERLGNYPILDEEDYSQRECEAALENYKSEMGRQAESLPEGWESEVYSWFSDNGMTRHIENRDDNGAWAPKEAITEALVALGLMPTHTVNG
jgi:hypothetical protein